MNKNVLTYIEIGKLFHHPNNPRKELGDLTELTESIKQNGIMQNLTVVPIGNVDGYYVVIGNRRLEAADKAGLKELPCVIAEMTEQEQIGTMLVENIQRSDLTAYEQAQGFQLMLDLGEDISAIADKTGFSQSTVRRRVKLLELDGDKLKKASERQVSLADLDRLNQIEDIKLRNKLLDDVGTNNFDYRIKNALTEQERKAHEKEWHKLAKENGLNEIASADRWNGSYDRIVCCGDPDKDEEIDKFLAAVESHDEVYFFVSFGTITLFKSADKAESDPQEIERAKAREERERRTTALKEAGERAYELRVEFLKNISNATAKKHIKEIAALLGERAYAAGYYAGFRQRLCNQLLNVEAAETAKFSEVKDTVERSPERSLLYIAYSYWGDSQNNRYNDWNGCYSENENLDRLYDFLKALGYTESDEEAALRNGTSELYAPQAEDDDEDYDDEEFDEDDEE